MKRIRKQIGSLLLSVCMVFTMFPTVVFAEEGAQDSGISPGTSEITAFTDLAEDVALQEVETGTTLEELNLPSTLTVTVTTGSAITATVSGDDMETDSEVQETETQEETTIEVSDWAVDPDYDGDTARDYTFTPTLDIPEGTTLADGVTPPQIMVTVEEIVTPMLLGAEMQLLGSDTDITVYFTDLNFLAEVRKVLGKNESDPIYDTDDFASVTTLSIPSKSIASLAGIQYFTALTELDCSRNQLTGLDVSSNTALTKLSCYLNQLTVLDVSNNTALTELICLSNQLTGLDVSSNTALTILNCYLNQLTGLDVSSNTALTQLFCSYNYMATESAVTGLNTSLTTSFIFNPQKTSTSTYLIVVNNGTASSSTAVEGATITITANTPVTGKQFKEWTVDSGGVTLASTTSASTTFTMPANMVEITATYEDISASGTDITADFIDPNFLAEVRKVLGKNESDPIYDTDDFASVTTLSIPSKSIASLAGIQYFTALTELNCSRNQLTGLDVSSNTTLTKLFCYFNQLIGLDVSNNTALTMLNCSSNKLTGLDVSSNTALTILNCYLNQLIGLDVSSNTALTMLICSTNKLTELDVSSNTALTELSCSSNKLTGLDVSKNTALTQLSCSYNYMATESAVTGLNTSLTTSFTFNPQKTSTSTYLIVVNNGTASSSTAVEGATITITANTPVTGKQFKEWTVDSGGVTLASTTSASTTFTMPASMVSVTATYETIAIPDPTPTSTPTPTSGKVIKSDAVVDNGVPVTMLNNNTDDLKDKVFTADELTRIASGTDAKIYLEVVDISKTVSQAEKDAIAAKLVNDTIGLYLDISLYKKVGDESAEKITNPNGKISVSVKVPSALINTDTSNTRTYKVVRIHDGVASIIEGIYDATTQLFTFETDEFSTYALIYSDKVNTSSGDSENGTRTSTPTKDDVPKTGDNTPIGWLFALVMMSGAGLCYLRKKRKLNEL